MNRRRRRSRPGLVFTLLVLIGFFLYVDFVIVPQTPPLFMPTPTPTRPPESFVTEAEDFLATGKVTQAMAAYEGAIHADPNNASNYLALARLQVFNREFAKAQENAENALLLNPNNALALAIRGWVLALMEEPDYLQAEGLLNQALELDPNNALAHAYLAEVLGLREQNGVGEIDTMDRAVQHSSKALELDPSLMETHRARGYIQLWTGNIEAAIAEFEQAIGINKNVADLYMALGQCYFYNQQSVEAISAFTQSFSLNPSDPMANYMISRTYLRDGDFAKAAQYAKLALEIDPGDAVLNGNMGSIYFKGQQYKRAVPFLRLAIVGGLTETGEQVVGIPLDESPRSLEFYSRYGLSLAYSNECGEALQIAEQLLTTFPDDENTAYNAQLMIDTCQQNLIATPTAILEETPAGDPAANPAETPAP